MNGTSIHTGLDLLTRRLRKITPLRVRDQVELRRPLRGMTIAGSLWPRGETERAGKLAAEPGLGRVRWLHASRWLVVLSDRSTRKTIVTLGALLLALSAAFFGAAIAEGGLTAVALILLWSANLAGIALTCFITHRLLMASIIYRAGKTYDRAVEALDLRLGLLE